MNAGVNISYLKYISQEIQDYAGEMSGLLAGLEGMETELRKQSVLQPYLRSLGRVRDDIAEEKYKLNILAQSLENIGRQYSRAEQKIEDGFDEKRPVKNLTGAGKIDVSKLNERINSLLYGGEIDGKYK